MAAVRPLAHRTVEGPAVRLPAARTGCSSSRRSPLASGEAIPDAPLRTRFAPSPTGDLHLGGAWTALASWALARATGGTLLLRVEDIETPRVVAGSEARILEDLAWLGLDADEGPHRQSERGALYETALEELALQGRL